MPTEYSVDYLLGRILVIRKLRWRVLEYKDGRLRVLCMDRPDQRGLFALADVQRLIRNGTIGLE